MRKLLYIISSSIFSITSLFAQGNTAYDLMLKTLYSNSVDVVMPADVINERDVVYLDARERNEFDVSHIKNSIWVGYDNFKQKYVDLLPRDAKVVVYCSVGYRSEKIGEKLKKMGFEDVSNLYGGIFQWKNDGYTVVDNNNAPTEKVHAYSMAWGIWLTKGEKVY